MRFIPLLLFVLGSAALAQFSLSTRLEAATSLALSPALSLSLTGRLDAKPFSQASLLATLSPSLDYNFDVLDRDGLEVDGYASLDGSFEAGLLNTPGSVRASTTLGLDLSYDLSDALNLRANLEADSDLLELVNEGFAWKFSPTWKGSLDFSYSGDPADVAAGWSVDITPPPSDRLFDEPDPDDEADDPPPGADYAHRLYLEVEGPAEDGSTARVRLDTTLDDFTLTLESGYDLDSGSSLELTTKLEKDDFGMTLEYVTGPATLTLGFEFDRPPKSPLNFLFKTSYRVSPDLRLTSRLDLSGEGYALNLGGSLDLDPQTSLDLDADIGAGKFNLSLKYRVRF